MKEIYSLKLEADKCNIRQVAGLKQAARFRHTQVYCQGRLYILGGCKVLKEAFSDIWFLDLENKQSQGIIYIFRVWCLALSGENQRDWPKKILLKTP